MNVRDHTNFLRLNFPEVILTVILGFRFGVFNNFLLFSLIVKAAIIEFSFLLLLSLNYLLSLLLCLSGFLWLLVRSSGSLRHLLRLLVTLWGLLRDVVLIHLIYFLLDQTPLVNLLILLLLCGGQSFLEDLLGQFRIFLLLWFLFN